MKSYIFYILCSLFLGVSLLSWINTVQAWAVPIERIQNFNDEIKSNTLNTTVSIGEDPIKVIKDSTQSILTTIKTILSWLMVIYIVYAGAQMIMSMWTDEDSLSSWKRQLWYTVVAFVFINIPGALFNAFNSNSSINVTTNDASSSSWFKTPGENQSNLFFDAAWLWNTLNWDIIGFIEIIISFIAILVIIVAATQMIISKWDEEVIKESKGKITWSIASLFLIWFIESWKLLVFKGKIEDGTSFFETLTNLLFFFAGPVAIVFLTIAAYTYITANGDDEKLKKAKSIVVNVVLATIILLASYTFLLDLITL
jgi:NADH:ubiquinone oxidoreductase subunit 6 (subunit J)